MGEEERIVEELIDEAGNIEIEESIVSVVNEEMQVTAESEMIEAHVVTPEIVPIVVSESVGSAALRVVADHSPYLPDQHTIGAITGLREELDEIERLKTVYSDGRNQANYYLWYDENPLKENRNGYFVSVHEDDNKLYICGAAEDEFGVTVSGAGFIGGQDIVIRDERYGLVVHSGLVGVRCETDVATGDYVVSSEYGVAKKTDGTYGYLVTSISDIEGVPYAIISLNTPSTQMQKFSGIVQDVNNRMESAEINIATAISVANAAYNKARAAQEWTEGNVENIAGDISDIKGDIGNINNAISGVEGSVNSAILQAQRAEAEAVRIGNEANDKNNTTNSHLHSLMKALVPDETWVDPEGTEWNTWFENYVNQDGFPTSTTIKNMDSDIKDVSSMASQTAMGFENIVTSIDKYSVGEWSQSYGLNMVESRNILQRGMIYVPTVEHDEPYAYTVIDNWSEDGRDINIVYNVRGTTQYYYYQTKLNDDGIAVRDENGSIMYEWVVVDIPTIHDNIQEFTRGYYYTWNGYYWVESDHPVVYFSDEYVLPSAECLYWYRETFEELSHEEVTYKPYGLYKYEPNIGWIEVNVLDGNVMNRTVSAIRQTANQISIDVTNARNDIAALELKIGEGGASTTMLASVMIEVEGAADKLYKSGGEVVTFINEDELRTNGPSLSNCYYAVGETMPYDVYEYVSEEYVKIVQYSYDGVLIRQPNVASIIAAVNNDGDSSVGINADKINFEGYATFIKDGNNNVTAIYGDEILSGYIISGNYKQEDGIVYAGTMIDLYNGSIYTPNFTLDQYGNVSMAGRVSATSGYIAGFTINHAGNWYYNGDLEPGQAYYFVADDVNYYFIAPSDDILTFSSTISGSTLTCGDIFVEYDNRTTIPDDATRIELIKGHSYIGYDQSTLHGIGDGSAGVYIAPDGIGLGNGNFYVDNLGNVIMKGSITMSGVITWNTDSNPVKVKYSSSGTGTPLTSPSYWHDDYNDDYDYYASYSYDGGVTWTNAIKIRGEDGSRGPSGSSGKDANLHEWGIFDLEESFVSSEIIYSPLLAGKFAVADKSTGNLTGYMGHATGYTQYWGEDGEPIRTDTEGIAIHANELDSEINSSTTFPYVIVTDYGAKMSCSNNSLYVTTSGVYCVQNGGTPQLVGGGGSGGTVVAVFG